MGLYVQHTVFVSMYVPVCVRRVHVDIHVCALCVCDYKYKHTVYVHRCDYMKQCSVFAQMTFECMKMLARVLVCVMLE